MAELRRRRPAAPTDDDDDDLADLMSKQQTPKPQKRGKWNKYLLLLVVIIGIVIIGLNRTDHHPSKLKLKYGKHGCNLFMGGGGSYSLTNQIIKYTQGWGCSIFLGEPWSEGDVLRDLIIKTMPKNAATTYKPVDEVSYEDFETNDDFKNEYANPRVPMVAKDAADFLGLSDLMSEGHLTDVCSSSNVDLIEYNSSTTEVWGGMLEHADGAVPLSQFLSALHNDATHSGYVHDWSIPTHCPSLLETISIPKQFSLDYLRITGHSCRYQMAWPSLFIGNANRRTTPQTASLSTHSWFVQLEGHRKWRIVSANETLLMYPNPYSYGVDLFEPDFEKFPLAKLLTVHEVITSPGDLIFIPSEAVYQSEGILGQNPSQRSVSFSNTFMDQTCFSEALKSTQEAGTVDEMVHDLARQLLALNESGLLPHNEADHSFSWEEYKSQTLPRLAKPEEKEMNSTEKIVIYGLGGLTVVFSILAYLIYKDLV